MSGDPGERHARLVHFLANGCTKLTRALIGKLVENAKPTDSEGANKPWTLADFLYDRQRQMPTIKNEARYKKLFPGRREETEIEEWDLSLLCFVVLNCAEDSIIKQDVKKLLSIRNKTYHTANATIEKEQFEHFINDIEVIVYRCCKFIDKQEFTQEMQGFLDQCKKENIVGYNEDLQVVQEWYESDPIAELNRKVDGLSNDHQKMLDKLDEMMTLLKTTGISGITLPDTNVELIVKNCSREKETVISEYLVKLLTPKMSKDLPNLTGPDKDKVMDAVREAMSELLKGDREIEDIYHACVIVRIRCSSFGSLRDLLISCIDGQMTKAFQALQEHLRVFSECTELELDASITHFEFNRCLEATVMEIAKSVNTFTGQEAANDDRPDSIVGTDLSTNVEVARVTDGSVKASRSEDGSIVVLNVQPSTINQAENIWQACRFGAFNEKLKGLSSVLQDVYGYEHLSITARLENDSPYNTVFQYKNTGTPYLEYGKESSPEQNDELQRTHKMSDNLDRSCLQDYIKRLRHQARIEKNDVRHRHYAGYVNEFVRHFGNERVYLVGSTGENLRLRWSKDGGDSDFLLCCGWLEIPVENLEFRTDTPCFVWLKADGLKSKIKFRLVEDRYIPTSMLRTVSPELFTMLRGIYLIVTSTLDTVPGRKSRVTTSALRSRVGLSRTEYRNLQIDHSGIPHPRERKHKRACSRNEARIENTRTPEINPKDKEMIDLIINMIVMARHPEGKGSRDSQFGNFAHVIHRVQKRRQLGSESTMVIQGNTEEGAVTYVNDLDEMPGTGGVKRTKSPDGADIGVDTNLSGVKATYEEKTSIDYVPAFRVKGSLNYMITWKERCGYWPKMEDRERISRYEVFVVSRYAPIAPDVEKDFCLSFNQPEMELAKCFSETQRDVFLILKSYLKGGFQTKHSLRKVGSELKLKTFHLKTALYWVSETEDPNLWQEGNTIEAVRKVLVFLEEAVRECRLKHYFIPDNNLFAGMAEKEKDLINECIHDALSDPVAYIKHFFDLDDGELVPITLTEREVENLLEMNEDGGLEREADNIEEALNDFHRAMNEGPRDGRGNSPIIDAIEATLKRYLQDEEQGELADLQKRRELEKTKSQVTTLLGTLRVTQATNAAGVLNNVIGTISTPESGSQVSSSASSSQNQGQQLLTDAISLLTSSRNMDRESRHQAENDLKYKALLQVSDSASPSSQNQEQQLLADAIEDNNRNIDREFTESRRQSRRQAENELKYKAFSFFFGKP